MNKKSIRSTLLPFFVMGCVFFAIIAIWEIVVIFLHISPVTLVAPSEIYPLIIHKWPLFLKELLFTYYEIGWGWILGNGMGVICAICLYQFKNASKTLVSISVFINAVPLVALSAIIAGIIGTTPESKICIVALICFFPMFISALTGFTRLPTKQRDLFKTYSANRIQLFCHLVFPHGLPFIMTALKLSTLSAIFAAITSEFFGSHGGIGQLILANRGLYNLAMVWGAIFYLVVTGALFYFSIGYLQKRIVFWMK